MQQYRSPFFIVDELLSPLICEDIIYRLNNLYPETDDNDVPLKTTRYNKLSEVRILPHIENVLPELEEYYGFESEGILPIMFEWYVPDFKVMPAKSDAFAYGNGKWKRINDIGFTGIIFLNDFNNSLPFDDDYEVYGGKLEFVNHKFGFNPKRGTLVFFPEAPNFVHSTAQVHAGELTQIRFHVVPTTPYVYNMNNFPGHYKVWFPNN